MPERSSGAARLRVGVLASGRGSNLRALVVATRASGVRADVVVVVSDRADADALAYARVEGIPAVHLDPRQHPTREAHDKALIGVLDEHRVGLVCLAGYMRILTPELVRHFAGRLLNVHPALLPAFPGLHAPRQALDHGVRVTGATVHFVDEGVDTGPIVLQAAVPVHDDDSVETLSARILEQEHRLYPNAVQMLLERNWRVEGRRVLAAAR